MWHGAPREETAFLPFTGGEKVQPSQRPRGCRLGPLICQGSASSFPRSATRNTRPNVPNSSIRDQIRGLEDGQQGSALASAAGVSAGQMCLSLNTLGREGSKCTSCLSRIVNKKR